MSKPLEKAIEILKKVGLSDELLKSIQDETKAESVDSDTSVEEIFNAQKAIILEPGGEYIKDIVSQTRASVLRPNEEKVFKKFKEFGITQDEFDKIPDGDKLGKIIDLAYRKAKDHKAPADQDSQKEIDRLCLELVTREDEIRKIREEEIPAVENRWKNQIQETQTAEILNKTFREISTGADGKSRLLIDEDASFFAVRASLDKSFDLVHSENGILLKEKGKDILAKKDSKNLSLSQAMIDISEKVKLFKKSEEPQKNSFKEKSEPPTKINTAGGNGFQKELERRKTEQAV